MTTGAKRDVGGGDCPFRTTPPETDSAAAEPEVAELSLGMYADSSDTEGDAAPPSRPRVEKEDGCIDEGAVRPLGSGVCAPTEGVMTGMRAGPDDGAPLEDRCALDC